jgi:hypothetical protein
MLDSRKVSRAEAAANGDLDLAEAEAFALAANVVAHNDHEKLPYLKSSD